MGLKVGFIVTLFIGVFPVFLLAENYPDTCGYFGPPHAEPGNSFCSNEEFNVIAALPTTGGILHWFLDPDLTVLLGTGSYLYPLNIVGTTTYYVVGVEGECVSEYTTVDVEIYEAPNVEITPYTPFLNDSIDFVTLSSNYTAGNEWNPFSLEQELIVFDSGSVQLVVTDANGCSGVDSVFVNWVEFLDPNPADFTDLFYVPNAFTPNNDGLNDVFYVSPSDDVQWFELVVYSRSGAEVFRSKNNSELWMGGTVYFNQSGIYNYRIIFSTILFSGELRGSVMMIK